MAINDEIRVNELEFQLAEALEGYEQAVEDIEHWASYSSEYFKAKYAVMEDIEAHKKRLNELRNS